MIQNELPKNLFLHDRVFQIKIRKPGILGHELYRRLALGPLLKTEEDDDVTTPEEKRELRKTKVGFRNNGDEYHQVIQEEAKSLLNNS